VSDKNTFENVLEGLRGLTPDMRKKAFSTLKRERISEESERSKRQRERPNSHFSMAHTLKRIPNPQNASYEQKIYIPEFTFVGAINQPDFGEILITFYPKEWTIELKSLKKYKDSFRDAPMSYERLANVMFDDLTQVYEPIRLRLLMRLRPRGGISSCLTIDSDWSIRGGQEEFRDWTSNTDRFGFETHSAVKMQ
jgi:7-cyano-7-deazaguanine reductase